MFAYKEIITLDNPQQLNLKTPLPFLKGKKVEILIIVEDDIDETDYLLSTPANRKHLLRAIENVNNHTNLVQMPSDDL